MSETVVRRLPRVLQRCAHLPRQGKGRLHQAVGLNRFLERIDELWNAQTRRHAALDVFFIALRVWKRQRQRERRAPSRSPRQVDRRGGDAHRIQPAAQKDRARSQLQAALDGLVEHRVEAIGLLVCHPIDLSIRLQDVPVGPFAQLAVGASKGVTGRDATDGLEECLGRVVAPGVSDVIHHRGAIRCSRDPGIRSQREDRRREQKIGSCTRPEQRMDANPIAGRKHRGVVRVPDHGSEDAADLARTVLPPAFVRAQHQLGIVERLSGSSKCRDQGRTIVEMTAEHRGRRVPLNRAEKPSPLARDAESA